MDLKESMYINRKNMKSTEELCISYTDGRKASW